MIKKRKKKMIKKGFLGIYLADGEVKGWDVVITIPLLSKESAEEVLNELITEKSFLERQHPFFVDEVIVLKEAINDIVSDPETKRRIYNRASELMERRKTENKKTNEQI